MQCSIYEYNLPVPFSGQQLWKSDGKTLENKAGVWKSDANWTLPTVGSPGNIKNTLTDSVLSVSNNDTEVTGDFFEEWNEITPQTHIRKFEEITA